MTRVEISPFICGMASCNPVLRVMNDIMTKGRSKTVLCSSLTTLSSVTGNGGGYGTTLSPHVTEQHIKIEETIPPIRGGRPRSTCDTEEKDNTDDQRSERIEHVFISLRAGACSKPCPSTSLAFLLPDLLPLFLSSHPFVPLHRAKNRKKPLDAHLPQFSTGLPNASLFPPAPARSLAASVL